MFLDEEKLKKLIDEVCVIEDIKIHDIPCVDLYMDQVTSFFDDKLSSLKREEEEKILTKTMINNYAKARILLPVKNKKYTKENIILLNLIYSLKQILSINDISLLLGPLLGELQGELQKEEESSRYLNDIYTKFLELKNGREMEFKESFQKSLGEIGEEFHKSEDTNEKEEKAKLLLMVLLLINGASIQKRMAEKIIDNFFKDIDSKKK
ncbi:DUF1836 domain-containing protein [Clostridium sp. KNHs214]|uniref:DUF1836 domain-containing protein n=1 Tax=Clostridium sp. KNHs214 TaxID=1540257 RepID=UPI00054D4713|nr:DUF1836 domain-containing protein [Clostridium sp. KNHs214]